MKKLMPLLFAASVVVALPAVAESPFEKASRDLLANFNAGRFEAVTTHFNGTMTQIAPPATMKAMSEQLTAKMGAFRSITKVRELNEDGLRVVEMITAYEKGPVSVKVVFDDTNRIGSVVFSPMEAVDPALEQSARELLSDITAGRLEAASKRFDDKLRIELPPQKLAVLARNLGTTFGPFRTVTDVRQRSDASHKIIDLTAAYEKAPAKVSVVFDSKGNVSGISIGALNK